MADSYQTNGEVLQDFLKHLAQFWVGITPKSGSVFGRRQQLVGKETLARLMALAAGGHVDELFECVLTQHYDPCYQRSTRRSYGRRTKAANSVLESLDSTKLASVARQLVEAERARLVNEGPLLGGQRTLSW